MSTRQLRKLRQQQELTAQEGTHKQSSDIESESDGDQAPFRRKGNAFAGFAALGSDRDDDADDNDDDYNDEEKVAADDDATPQAASEAPVQNPMTNNVTRPAKPKKKKKKSKNKVKKQHESTKSLTEAPREDVGDEIDRVLEELQLSSKPGDRADSIEIDKADDLSRLMRINSHHLKLMNEMRNLFGRETIAAAVTEDEPQGNGPRQQQQPQHVDLETYLRGAPNQPKMPDVLIRRNPFIQWKDTWPRAGAAGLTMKCLDQPSQGPWEFTFAHESEYMDMELEFLFLVQSYNHQEMFPSLRRHPYHVSTLLQISKVAKQDRNAALSSDLCERALFTLGRVTLSSFRKKLEEGRVRMDFMRPENRQFWLAGYQYIKGLIPKGTYRTALEWAKLILSLSPEDHYGMLNYVHFLAIRAHESQWFLDLCATSLFSVENDEPMAAYVAQSVVLAKLQLQDERGARETLTNGMRTLPWLYTALFSALNLDIPKAIWGIQPRNDAEALYTQLYIHMAKTLWDNAQAMSLLKEIGNATDKPDMEALPATVAVRYNTARFAYLEGSPALLGLIPRWMLSLTPNYDFDPLPPPQFDNVFSYDFQKLPWIPDSILFDNPDPPMLQHNFVPAAAIPPDDGATDDDFGPGTETDATGNLGSGVGTGAPGDLDPDGEFDPFVENGPPGVLQRMMDYIFYHMTPNATPGETDDPSTDEEDDASEDEDHHTDTDTEGDDQPGRR